jgi:hypothetical protein
VAQAVEHLPRKCKALSSNSSTAKKKKKKAYYDAESSLSFQGKDSNGAGVF